MGYRDQLNQSGWLVSRGQMVWLEARRLLSLGGQGDGSVWRWVQLVWSYLRRGLSCFGGWIFVILDLTFRTKQETHMKMETPVRQNIRMTAQRMAMDCRRLYSDLRLNTEGLARREKPVTVITRQMRMMTSSRMKVKRQFWLLFLKCCQSPSEVSCWHSNSILCLHISQSKRPCCEIWVSGVVLLRSIHCAMQRKWTYFTEPAQRQGETMESGCCCCGSYQRQILHSVGGREELLSTVMAEWLKVDYRGLGAFFPDGFYSIGSSDLFIISARCGWLLDWQTSMGGSLRWV